MNCAHTHTHTHSWNSAHILRMITLFSKRFSMKTSMVEKHGCEALIASPHCTQQCIWVLNITQNRFLFISWDSLQPGPWFLPHLITCLKWSLSNLSGITSSGAVDVWSHLRAYLPQPDQPLQSLQLTSCDLSARVLCSGSSVHGHILLLPSPHQATPAHPSDPFLGRLLWFSQCPHCYIPSLSEWTVLLCS